MKLLIAIPALNEEDSIESIIQRSLDARSYIQQHSPVTEVEITVVSDGSTDRTAAIAGRYLAQINVLVFRKNRGYGAAIKEAWRRSDADILGFLDADGTCDPRFFAPLCNRLAADGADIVLGGRLNRQSRMPPVRRVGNFVFAAILTTFSSSRVRDTASGMRVVRRSALPKILPLPDGLHFTPAMSARALLSDGVKIVEIEMPYHERAGESKLRIVKDGFRFLKVILEAAFLYRPSRPLALAGSGLLLLAAGLMLGPSLYYLQHHSVLSWMIYRFLVSDLCGIAGCLLLCGSYLSGEVVSMVLADEVGLRKHRWAGRFFRNRFFWVAPALCTAAGVALVFSSLVQRVETGGTDEHWSRYVAMTFCLSVALILAVTRILDYCLTLVSSRVHYLRVLLPRDLQPSEEADVAQAVGD